MRTLLAGLLLVTAGPAWGEPDEKSPAVAGALSIGLGVGGAALFVFGEAANGWLVDDSPGVKWNDPLIAAGAVTMALGPTVGHFYADNTWNLGLAIRLAGAGALMLGGAFDSAIDSGGDLNFVSVQGAGLAIYAAGTVWEMATAPRAARAYNRRHRAKAIVTPVASNASAAVMLAGSF